MVKYKLLQELQLFQLSAENATPKLLSQSKQTKTIPTQPIIA